MKQAKYIIVALVVALMGFYGLSSANASNDPVNSGTTEVAYQGGAVCSDGSTPVSTTWDFEDGEEGWTTSYVSTGFLTSTFVLTTGNSVDSTSNSPSGGNRFYARDVDGEGAGFFLDQYLDSPEFEVPTGTLPTLSFYNLQAFEISDGQCWDSGWVEISNDGGTSWDYVSIITGAPFTVTPAYDADIHDEFDGEYPQADAFAWCPSDPAPSDPASGFRDWGQATVDLSPYAGETIQVRFHSFSDNLQGAYGWLIDDVSTEVCPVGPPTAVTVNTIQAGTSLPIVPMVGAGLLALAAAGMVVRRFRK